MKIKAFFFVILAGILWGTSGIFVHYLAPYGITSLQMTMMRGLVSFVCLAVFALARERSLFCVRPLDLLYFIGMGLGLFGTASCYFISMQMTSVSTAVVLMYTAPVYVMIFSVLFLGERLSPLKLVAVASMLVGCCLVSGVIGGLKFDTTGILIGAASGICFAGYNILTKLAMQRGCRAPSATLYCFLSVTVVGLVTSAPWEMIGSAAKAPTVTLPLLLALGVVTCTLPYIFYTLAMKELPAGTASALGIVEPMSATIFSVLLFSEPLDWFSGAGIVLILLSVCLLSRTKE
ncbi:MAG: EamA family transporter [Clostridia bacterium]|nr:EamA family transporter [Clostridia bacterium]